jgi:hypothetical protein
MCTPMFIWEAMRPAVLCATPAVEAQKTQLGSAGLVRTPGLLGCLLLLTGNKRI